MVELKAKIIEIRGEIRVQRTREKMEGEIVRHNPDGTTRIRTEKGELTVRLRGRDIPPEGAKIEIEIPPGEPPKQVTVRPPPQENNAPTPPRTETAPPQVEVSQQTHIDTRPDPRRTEDIVQTPAENLPQAALKAETVISLTPLPPQQAQQVIQPALYSIETKIVTLPLQIQVLAESTLPQILYEQTAQLLSISIPAPIAVPVSIPLVSSLEEPAIQQPASLPAPEGKPAAQLIQHIIQTAEPFLQQAPSPLPPVLILPATSHAPQAVPPPPGQLNSFPFTLPLNTAPPQNSVFTVSQAPQPFDIRVQTITPPQVSLTQIPAQSSQTTLLTPPTPAAIPQGHAGSITGTVTGITPQNLPVLSFFTPGLDIPQNFIMPFQAGNLILGTQIQMIPQPGAPHSLQTTAATATTTTATATALSPFIPFEFFSNFQWGAMDELNQALQQTAPQAAQALAGTTINAATASTPARLPAIALFFIAAIRSGNISGWLGDKTIDALGRSGKSDSLGRLNRDISGLQRTSAEPTGQDWRATALPVMDDANLHKMMLYYRHDGHDGQKEGEDRRGTRFIFDLSLNRLGDVQLDGLHRPGRLDLIVRTKNGLSQAMQQKMRRTYTGALEQTALTGELSFQNQPGQFVKIDMPKESTVVSA